MGNVLKEMVKCVFYMFVIVELIALMVNCSYTKYGRETPLVPGVSAEGFFNIRIVNISAEHKEVNIMKHSDGKDVFRSNFIIPPQWMIKDKKGGWTPYGSTWSNLPEYICPIKLPVGKYILKSRDWGVGYKEWEYFPFELTRGMLKKVKLPIALELRNPR